MVSKDVNNSVMPLAGPGGLYITWNFGAGLTLLQPGREGVDYAHHITAYLFGFQNLTISLKQS